MGPHDEMTPLVAYLYLAHVDGDTDIALRSERKFSVARYPLYEARSGRLCWLPFWVSEDIRALTFTVPNISMDDWRVARRGILENYPH